MRRSSSSHLSSPQHASLAEELAAAYLQRHRPDRPLSAHEADRNAIVLDAIVKALASKAVTAALDADDYREARRAAFAQMGPTLHSAKVDEVRRGNAFTQHADRFFRGKRMPVRPFLLDVVIADPPVRYFDILMSATRHGDNPSSIAKDVTGDATAGDDLTAAVADALAVVRRSFMASNREKDGATWVALAHGHRTAAPLEPNWHRTDGNEAGSVNELAPQSGDESSGELADLVELDVLSRLAARGGDADWVARDLAANFGDTSPTDAKLRRIRSAVLEVVTDRALELATVTNGGLQFPRYPWLTMEIREAALERFRGSVEPRTRPDHARDIE